MELESIMREVLVQRREDELFRLFCEREYTNIMVPFFWASAPSIWSKITIQELGRALINRVAKLENTRVLDIFNRLQELGCSDVYDFSESLLWHAEKNDELIRKLSVLRPYSHSNANITDLEINNVLRTTFPNENLYSAHLERQFDCMKVIAVNHLPRISAPNREIVLDAFGRIRSEYQRFMDQKISAVYKRETVQ